MNGAYVASSEIGRALFSLTSLSEAERELSWTCERKANWRVYGTEISLPLFDEDLSIQHLC